MRKEDRGIVRVRNVVSKSRTVTRLFSLLSSFLLPVEGNTTDRGPSTADDLGSVE